VKGMPGAYTEYIASESRAGIRTCTSSDKSKKESVIHRTLLRLWNILAVTENVKDEETSDATGSGSNMLPYSGFGF